MKNFRIFITSILAYLVLCGGFSLSAGPYNFASESAYNGFSGIFALGFDPPKSGGSRWQKGGAEKSAALGGSETRNIAGEQPSLKDVFKMPKSGGSRWQAGQSSGVQKMPAEKISLFSPPKSNGGSRWQRGVETGSAKGGETKSSELGKTKNAKSGEFKICVFPLEGAISSPQVKFVKRAVEAAESAKAAALIVDMNTPGGDLDSTIKIMEELSAFGGMTVCYVNPDAISAGSFIAVACDKIFFSPKGVMGAAEAVNAGGGDIEDSMKRKVTSFIGAKVRAIEPSGNPRRAAVQRAMNDPDFELKINGKVLKPKGELLTLTAAEAAAVYDGSPLLSDGTEENVEGVAEKISGGKPFEIMRIEHTWADGAAIFMSSVAPILFGLAIFLVIMDLKGGGIGVLSAVGFGIAVCVFLGINMSGLAGYEGILILIAGAALIALEILFFPGTLLPTVLGVCAVVIAAVWTFGGIDASDGSKLWGEWEESVLPSVCAGITRLGLSVLVAGVCAAVLGRYFECAPIFGKLVLKPCLDGNADSRGAAQVSAEGGKLLKKGMVGVCITDLTPSGKANFDGTIADVRSDFGSISQGEKIEIIEKKDFNFIVKKYSKDK